MPPVPLGGRALIRGTTRFAWPRLATTSGRLTASRPCPLGPHHRLAAADRKKPMQQAAAADATDAEPAETYPVTVSVKTEAALDAARAVFGAHPTLAAGPGATAVLALPPAFVSPTASANTIPASSSPFPPPPFDPTAALARLATARLGHILLTAPALPSTQTLLQTAGAALPDGTVAVADVQVSGRGRSGNAWASPPGCLMASAFLAAAPIPGARLPFVQYAVALGVVAGVRALVRGAAVAAGWNAQEAGAHAAAADVRIKWPNDVYAGRFGVSTSSSTSPPVMSHSRKKLAGVLCHSTYVSGPGGVGPGGGGAFRVVAGFGVNVTNEPPAPSEMPRGVPSSSASSSSMLDWARVADLVPLPPGGDDGSAGDPAVARAAAVEAAGGRPALLAAILGEVEAGLARLADPASDSWAPGGVDSTAYLSTWLHSGQVVTVVDPPADGSGAGDRRGGGGGGGGRQASPPSSSSSPTDPARPPPGTAVTITGLAPSGYLLALDEGTGTAYELHPDGNSLDFFSGLVRRRVVK